MNKRRLSNKERRVVDEQKRTAEFNAPVLDWQRKLIEERLLLIEKDPDSVRPIAELMKELR